MEKEIVFLGLGRMGSAMSELLVEKNYTVHGFDVNESARKTAESFGVKVYQTASLAIEACSSKQKVVWLMVPSKFVDDAIAEIAKVLQEGDVIIDGGNSFFKDSIKRHNKLQAQGIQFVDCGTSGGVEGARYGASLMVGGEEPAVASVSHIFKDLAATEGYGHVGAPGAGHYVKMIHNGIEYGMMGAIAEGVSVIESKAQQMQINMQEVLTAYTHGSIISSKLTNWLAESYNSPEYLKNIAGEVPKGETEVEMEYIIENEEVAVLEAALAQRKETRENPSRIGVFISAMRNQFGGHKTIAKDHNENS